VSTRLEFITKAKNRGFDREQIKIAMETRRQKIGAFDDDEEEAVTPGSARSQTLSNIGSAISGGIKKGVEETGKFISGAVTEPKETTAGLATGVLKELPKKDISAQLQATPFGAFEQPSFKELEQRQQIRGKEAEVAAQPEKPLSPTAERAAKVGAFGTKLGAGLALSTLVPAGGVLPTFAKGATANIPFAASQENLKDALVDMGVNTLVDVVTLGTGKLAKSAIGKSLKGLGEKIEIATIKPTAPALKNVKAPKGKELQVFKDNIFKHGLEGDLEKSLTKIESKFNNLTTQLDQKIKASDEQVDLVDMLTNVIGDMKKTPAKSFGSNIDSEKLFEKILSEIELISPEGVTNLTNAQHIKRAMGAMGAWQNGLRDAEATARENVYNRLYTEMRKEIELKAPEGVKEINQQLSELIPIEQAIIHRIPVKQRQDLISITDVISTAGALATGPKGWGLAILNKLSKTPVIGAGSFRTGEKVLGAPIFPAGKAASEALQETTTRREGFPSLDLEALSKFKMRR
jgi:hypothetical protein